MTDQPAQESIDVELNGLRVIAAAMAEIPTEAHHRTLRWLIARYAPTWRLTSSPPAQNVRTDGVA